MMFSTPTISNKIATKTARPTPFICVPSLPAVVSDRQSDFPCLRDQFAFSAPNPLSAPGAELADTLTASLVELPDRGSRPPQNRRSCPYVDYGQRHHPREIQRLALIVTDPERWYEDGSVALLNDAAKRSQVPCGRGEWMHLNEDRRPDVRDGPSDRRTRSGGVSIAKLERLFPSSPNATPRTPKRQRASMTGREDLRCLQRRHTRSICRGPSLGARRSRWVLIREVSLDRVEHLCLFYPEALEHGRGFLLACQRDEHVGQRDLQTPGIRRPRARGHDQPADLHRWVKARPVVEPRAAVPFLYPLFGGSFQNRLHHRAADLLRAGIELSKHDRRNTVVLAREPEQNVLRPDRFAPAGQRLPQRELQNLPCSRGQRPRGPRAREKVIARRRDLHHARPDLIGGHAQRAERLRRDSLGVCEQTKQDVLDTDISVTDLPCLQPRVAEHSTSRICESLGQNRSIPSPDSAGKPRYGDKTRSPMSDANHARPCRAVDAGRPAPSFADRRTDGFTAAAVRPLTPSNDRPTAWLAAASRASRLDDQVELATRRPPARQPGLRQRAPRPTYPPFARRKPLDARRAPNAGADCRCLTFPSSAAIRRRPVGPTRPGA